jgi:hypothetical protein
MVNSEAYAQATGAMLDTYLTASAPFRVALEKTMLKTLEQLAMPSRADIISIAERMTNIEMRLDDMEAKLDRIQQAIVNPGPSSTAKQTRTSLPRKNKPQARAKSKAAKRGKK